SRLQREDSRDPVLAGWQDAADNRSLRHRPGATGVHFNTAVAPLGASHIEEGRRPGRRSLLNRRGCHRSRGGSLQSVTHRDWPLNERYLCEPNWTKSITAFSSTCRSTLGSRTSTSPT